MAAQGDDGDPFDVVVGAVDGDGDLADRRSARGVPELGWRPTRPMRVTLFIAGSFLVGAPGAAGVLVGNEALAAADVAATAGGRQCRCERSGDSQEPGIGAGRRLTRRQLGGV